MEAGVPAKSISDALHPTAAAAPTAASTSALSASLWRLATADSVKAKACRSSAKHDLKIGATIIKIYDSKESLREPEGLGLSTQVRQASAKHERCHFIIVIMTIITTIIIITASFSAASRKK